MTKQKQQKHVSFATGHKSHNPPETPKASVPKRKEHQAPVPSSKGNKNVVQCRAKGKCKKEVDEKGVWTMSAWETTESMVREWDAIRGKWILVPETLTRWKKKRYDPKTGEYSYEWEYSIT
ncbi:hypothetical protein QCA50_009124 [Cerrena zonata]|uniref:Uncharacterized protein n=1 Tax=Cerrena zonata TaxID=2478898 RepID=A0AAW0G9U0_9APHY